MNTKAIPSREQGGLSAEYQPPTCRCMSGLLSEQVWTSPEGRGFLSKQVEIGREGQGWGWGRGGDPQVNLDQVPVRSYGDPFPKRQTDRHDWKHYLPTTSFVGGNKCMLTRSLSYVVFPMFVLFVFHRTNFRRMGWICTSDSEVLKSWTIYRCRLLSVMSAMLVCGLKSVEKLDHSNGRNPVYTTHYPDLTSGTTLIFRNSWCYCCWVVPKIKGKIHFLIHFLSVWVDLSIVILRCKDPLGIVPFIWRLWIRSTSLLT